MYTKITHIEDNLFFEVLLKIDKTCDDIGVIWDGLRHLRVIYK